MTARVEGNRNESRHGDDERFRQRDLCAGECANGRADGGHERVASQEPAEHVSERFGTDARMRQDRGRGNEKSNAGGDDGATRSPVSKCVGKKLQRSSCVAAARAHVSSAGALSMPLFLFLPPTSHATGAIASPMASDAKPSAGVTKSLPQPPPRAPGLVVGASVTGGRVTV